METHFVDAQQAQQEQVLVFFETSTLVGLETAFHSSLFELVKSTYH